MAHAHTTPDLTKNQKLVLAALRGTDAPQSAYAILDIVRPEGIKAPLQVYRALDRLLELGLVHKLESINAFMTCTHCHDDGHHDHHHHAHGVAAFAICDDCGKVSEFSDEEIDARLEAWTGKHGFKLSRTTIELRGRCAECIAG